MFSGPENLMAPSERLLRPDVEAGSENSRRRNEVTHLTIKWCIPLFQIVCLVYWLMNCRHLEFLTSGFETESF
jgi:hypothetical protein